MFRKSKTIQVEIAKKKREAVVEKLPDEAFKQAELQIKLFCYLCTNTLKWLFNLDIEVLSKLLRGFGSFNVDSCCVSLGKILPRPTDSVIRSGLFKLGQLTAWSLILIFNVAVAFTKKETWSLSQLKDLKHRKSLTEKGIWLLLAEKIILKSSFLGKVVLGKPV